MDGLCELNKFCKLNNIYLNISNNEVYFYLDGTITIYLFSNYVKNGFFIDKDLNIVFNNDGKIKNQYDYINTYKESLKDLVNKINLYKLNQKLENKLIKKNVATKTIKI